MGAITSDFVNLPADDNPRRVLKYERVYAWLTAKGHALPAQPHDTITRAQLLAHMRALAGQLVADELTTDPENRGYGGGTNQDDADALRAVYEPPIPRKLNGSNLQGYRTKAASTDMVLVAERWQNGNNPDFVNVTAPNGEEIRGVFIKFHPNTSNVALRGKRFKLDLATDSETLAFARRIPINVDAGERFFLAAHRREVRTARVFEVLKTMPYAPNELTADDVAGARS